jgi:hypothetical protein
MLARTVIVFARARCHMPKFDEPNNNNEAFFLLVRFFNVVDNQRAIVCWLVSSFFGLFHQKKNQN